MSITVNKTRLPGSVIKTASGAVASVSDARMRGAIGVEASFSPRQDLHGYANPWPAGGGKNKVLLTAETIQKPDWYTGNWIGTTLNTHNGINQTRGYLQSGAGGFVLSLNAGTYTFSMTSDNGQSCRLGVYSYDGETMTIILANVAIYNTGTRYYFSFDVPSGSVQIAVRPVVYSATSAYDLNDIQIEAGSTNTGFAPYSNLCPISGITSASAFVSQQYPDANPRSVTAQLGEERYGGSYDFVRGKLTLTWKYYNLPKTGWLRFVYDSGNYFLYKSIPYTDITTTDRINFLCDSLKPVSAVANDKAMGVISLATATGLTRCRPFETVAEWEAYLAEHDVHICFKIDPIVIDMTPAEFELFHRQNYVWSDVGDTALTYAAIHEHGG